ncbi:YihY/virulence factor BrkB family protein [Nocardioides nanhaiensis]|uniref:YihY/virulence factor BrkB family protein n=1 Tax=Nocardioides nanhaiensis TaxID=1476871 RepID=A0ABP8VTN7_9ACTN
MSTGAHVAEGSAGESGASDAPDSPSELDRRSWRLVARTTVHEFLDDQCTDLAAALTYYAVLALFPAVIALTSLLGLVGQGTSSVETLLEVLDDVGAGSVAEGVREPLLAVSSSGAAGWAFVLGLAGALWSASGYVNAFSRAMNRIYEIREGRPVWKLRPAMLALTAGLVLLVALTLLLLVVSGPVASAIGGQLGLGDGAVLAWNIAKWPVLLGIVVLVIALLYYLTPNIRQPAFRWISVGAVLALVVWAVASAGFGLYVANFSSYDQTYGALGGVIAFLLWLWITNVALLLGAELDSELERGRELQSGLPAEEQLQLPPRDDRGIRKLRAREADQRAEGRAIRRRAARSTSTTSTDDARSEIDDEGESR